MTPFGLLRFCLGNVRVSLELFCLYASSKSKSHSSSKARRNLAVARLCLEG